MSYKFGTTTSTGSKASIFRAGSLVSPVDGATYYFAWNYLNWTNSEDEQVEFLVPFNGTINKAYAKFTVSSLGSAENCTLKLVKNASSTVTISSTIKLNTTPVTANNTSLGLSVSQGDTIAVQFIAPTWATNPSFFITVTALIE